MDLFRFMLLIKAKFGIWFGFVSKNCFLVTEIQMVVCGGDAICGVLLDGARAGDGRALPGEGLHPGVLLRRAALPQQPAVRRRPQEYLPAQRVPRHQGKPACVPAPSGTSPANYKHGKYPF